MSRWVVPAVVVACVVSGCSGDAEAADVEGSLVLTDGTQIGYEGRGAKGEKCWGKGRFKDLAKDARVVVHDPDGEEAAVGELTVGRLQGDSESFFAAPCRFRFEVPGVPSDADGTWTVTVGKRDAVEFTPGETVGIELG